MNIKTNSKLIEPGDTFVALKGNNYDGHDFIEEAINRGANLIIAEKGTYNVQTLLVPDTHIYLCEYLREINREILNSIKIIGVTGTNGKTTSCFITSNALNSLGIKCGYIGTIGFYIGEKIKDLKNTTPDILEIYEMLKICYEKGCKYVCMEVSSQALSMHRLDGILFDYAVFTNLTEDHLDYHKTMEEYALAKQKLFLNIKKDGYAIINVDDNYNSKFIIENNNNVFYGFNNCDFKIIDYKYKNNYQFFKLNTEKYKTKLLGKYNIYNLTVMIIILKLLNIDYKQIKKIVLDTKAPVGRMEIIHYSNNLIIVDYAHTPDAVSKIISACREFCNGKIITIIGCGGNRDKNKRPIMGSISTELSDYVIFTNDNPRNENPIDILNDITNKLKKNNYEIVIKRKEAINKGIQMLQNNDILLVLGKGHENYQIIENKKIYFSDKETILDTIRR